MIANATGITTNKPAIISVAKRSPKLTCVAPEDIVCSSVSMSVRTCSNLFFLNILIVWGIHTHFSSVFSRKFRKVDDMNSTTYLASNFPVDYDLDAITRVFEQ